MGISVKVYKGKRVRNLEKMSAECEHGSFYQSYTQDGSQYS